MALKPSADLKIVCACYDVYPQTCNTVIHNLLLTFSKMSSFCVGKVKYTIQGYGSLFTAFYSCLQVVNLLSSDFTKYGIYLWLGVLSQEAENNTQS